MEVKINKEIRNYTESMFFGRMKKLLFFHTPSYSIMNKIPLSSQTE
ncbi:hypothetical protein DORFOR_03062 [Dorea formicigenerans ATCC 27755]|uniref:Uncharacterized protein n=1 Tax=Dorea formicigenerans ATCC 27755 TaxID=411461 RepID=B0G9U6_9FIRM|nr:hypothetical protein DORFOR_03062 [Dorea formicigenerans ATCC 27755]